MNDTTTPVELVFEVTIRHTPEPDTPSPTDDDVYHALKTRFDERFEVEVDAL